ncbi:MAG TPA: PAS domain S-box protein, partial [Methanospirillum sp.]|nr:PAS domain S-box protein [Methanospirillum sp.]
MGFVLYFTPDQNSITDALFRTIFFLIVAVTVTYISEVRSRSLKQARKSEEQYYSLFSNSILGIYRTSPAGQYLEINPAFAHIAGYETPEEMKTDIHDIGHQLYVHPEDRETLVKLLVSNGEIHGYEAECWHRSGSSIWISMNAKTVLNDAGNLLWIEGTIEDITARKKAEAELALKNEDLQATLEELSGSEEELKRQLEEILSSQIEIEEREKKYRQLFESNIAGISVHEIICDSKGKPIDYRFLDVNKAFEEFTGLHAEDIIGKRVRTVLPGIESYWIETYGEVARTGKTIHFENYSGDLGKYFDVTAYSTELGKFATLVLDVTPQKLSDIKIKENNAFLESLIDNAFGPIIVWNPDLRVIRINRAGELLVGRSAKELVGSSLEILFPPDDAERSLRLIRTTLEGVRWETVELGIQHQDGSIKTVLWNSSTIYDPESSKPVATIAQGRDVTQERLLEMEKDATTAQIQENIAKLAILNDGIRNPLSIITVIVDMANDSRLSETILAEVSRIDEMVSSLDREWAHSEKILDYLKKHTQIGRSFISGSLAVAPALNTDFENDISSKAKLRENLLPQEIQAQLYSILDSIDALVYVADIKTYEILY